MSYTLKNKDLTLISSPPPGSGVITNSIVGVMDLYEPDPLDKHRPLYWHRFFLFFVSFDGLFGLFIVSV